MAVEDLPPIAPGHKVRVIVFNTGTEYITTVQYPVSDYNWCTCLFQIFFIAAILSGVYYVVRWLSRQDALWAALKGQRDKEGENSEEENEEGEEGEEEEDSEKKVTFIEPEDDYDEDDDDDTDEDEDEDYKAY
ncbi:hypothetical protein M8J75_006195 [Diaphorina citri]|nr:hypothetical protein M8J75_006195 [Diaphorina citri]